MVKIATVHLNFSRFFKNTKTYAELVDKFIDSELECAGFMQLERFIGCKLSPAWALFGKYISITSVMMITVFHIPKGKC